MMKKNKKQPLISVILSTYNRGEYIKKAIESILYQTYKNIESIIIDDGSTDQTAEILFEFSKRDPRIIIVTNKTNLGLTRSLNKGIRNARGKYIARLDDDDFWCDQNKLEKQVQFLEEHPKYILVGGGIIRVDETGQEIVRHLLSEKDENIRKLILLDNCFTHSAVVFRKKAWEKTGGYDEKLNLSQDWDLWMKFGKLGKFYNFQKYFVCYLQGKQNRTNFNIRKSLRHSIEIRKKYRNDYPNFWKALLLGWAYYLYTFIPFRKQFHSIFSKTRRMIFGSPNL